MSPDMLKRDGGPAFPVPVEDAGRFIQCLGLSARDYFAAAALTGLCAEHDEAGTLISKGHDWLAEQSYACADAMLDVRQKGAAS